MRNRSIQLTLAGCAITVAACGVTAPPLVDDGANMDARCQPIAAGAANCFLPFPSSFYLRPDKTTATGYRVQIPKGVLPKNQVGADYDPARLNLLDGFSPATQIVANLKARVDAKLLVGERDDWAGSLRADSTVQLIAFDTGERVPLFAEVDQNAADKPDQDQVVLVHPALRLRPATRYVVVLQKLADTTGAPIVIKPFRALADGKVDTRSPLAGVQARYAEIFALLDKQGLARANLTLAWDFVTASDQQGYGHVLAMRDAAFARWQKDQLGSTVVATETPGDANILRELRGSFAVPSFLTDNTTRYAGLSLDAKGEPVDTGTNYDAKLYISVPRCAATATAPLPILVFGHGLFGDANQIFTDQQRQTAETLCMIEVSTDWIGLSELDKTPVVGKVFSDFSTFWQPTDRLQQAQVNFLVMARLASRQFKSMPELTVEGKPGGKPITDGKQIYYFGISQGGIEGNTFLSLSPEVSRGALNVGAGVYSLMLTRSADFSVFKGILDATYPSQPDQETLLALTQSYFDFSDPIAFVSHSLGTLSPTFPDPDTHVPLPPRHVLMQESRGDAEVPNLATRVLVRTLGVKQLAPAVEPVYGVSVADGPLDAAYTQWDVQPTPFPPYANVPPESGNAAHDAIGKLPELLAQLHQFFQPDGRINQTCKGPCVFPGAQ